MNKWNIQDAELAIELIKNGLNYSDIAQQLNRSIKSVKLKLNKLGYKTSEFKIEKELKCCECCNNIIENAGIKYCSSSCAAKINNSLFPKRISSFLYQDSSSHKNTILFKKKCKNCDNELIRQNSSYFCSQICHKDFQYKENLNQWRDEGFLGYTGKTIQLKKFIRRFLLEEANNKCSKCGWGEINEITQKAPLEINHIDGNAKNCIKDNLEVLCPNCHSLTHNFRNLNKNSARDRSKSDSN